jgi:membrane protein YdbS with pleckstrin-like domain
MSARRRRIVWLTISVLLEAALILNWYCQFGTVLLWSTAILSAIVVFPTCYALGIKPREAKHCNGNGAA